MANMKTTNLLVLGDLHVGSKNFNHDLFENWLKDAKNYCKHSKRKSKGYILLNGDLCDVARSSQDAWRSEMTVAEQVDFVVTALEPFRENILYSTVSNHEYRMYREFNLDLGQEIANRLKIPYGYDCFIDIPYNDDNDSKTVFMRHGNRTSKSYFLFMRNFISDMRNIDADLYICGHSHFLGHYTDIYRNGDNIGKKHYVVNGNFLNYLNSYANKHGYNFMLAGYPIITITENGEINCKLRWSERL